MITYVEMWRHAMDGVEHTAFQTKGGLMSLGSMSGLNIFFAQTSARMVQLLREISGAGMIMQPSEHDFMNPEFRPYLDKYMRGKDVDALSKARLLRLAHDLAISSFGMRQELYEYWHGGDPNRNQTNLLRSYDRAMMDRIKTLLTPLAHGEMPPPGRKPASATCPDSVELLS
jgi:4-hydroxyphenylacetate 3-monooxygenase/anthranilate 3-monooxygenase (FAD)/4-hydroxyphenylacetate 3-monooxygenase